LEDVDNRSWLEVPTKGDFGKKMLQVNCQTGAPLVISRSKGFRVAVLAVIALPALMLAQSQPKPPAKVVVLTRRSSGVSPLLSGPPETVTMKSGYVVLEPGRSVGRHSTEHHEEMLVVLEGQGEMIFQDGSKLQIRGGTALYCPPETEHDVVNTGTENLRYVFIVADAPSNPSLSQ
jgi:mannose-6-phosphate isomerase-like protein (cupin superfamily)